MSSNGHLEQRVKALEYEVKILKNEVQQVLLDIQEQILIHYYPSLHSDEGVVSSSTKAIETFESLQRSQGSVREIKKPQFAKPINVSLDATPLPRDAGGAIYEDVEDTSSLVELSDWVTQSVKKIGHRRVERVVKMYAQQGLLSASSQGTLVRLSLFKNGTGEPQHVGVHDVLNVLMKLNEVLGYSTSDDEMLLLLEKVDI